MLAVLPFFLFFFFFLQYFTDNYFAPHSIFSFGCKPLFFVKGSLLLTRDNGTHPKHREHIHEETLLHTHCEVRSSLDLLFYTIKPEMFDNEYSNPIHKHPWQIGPHQLS